MVRDGLRSFLNRERGDASLPFRVATLGMVEVSVVAAVMNQAVVGAAGVAALLLVPVGFVVSYLRRGKRNLLLKTALTLGLFAALAGFLDGVRGATTVDDTRAPLVAIFLWVQVMHSFDVPRLRDLNFSLAASVPLIALAGSLAFSTGFLVFVVVYAVLFVSGLVLGHEAEMRTGAAVVLARETRPQAAGSHARSLARPAAALLGATLVCTSVVFVFLPRLGGAQVASLPFSIVRRTLIPGFVGDVVNPGVAGPERPGDFDPDAYFGYGESVDLRARGVLSEDLVLRVRSPRPSLYRAQVFDVYDRGLWTSSDTDLEDLTQGGLDSITVPEAPEEVRTRVGPELVQTFYVERELPNLVFHAYRAHELYVPSSRVRVDDFSSIRLPFTLEEDTIYSVVSEVPQTSVDVLRFAPAVDPSRGTFARYLQLSASVSPRFRELARRITDPHVFTVDKANAIEAWLHANKRYRLDIPPDPPGRDPVETFVFDRDEGFCEQIATTMALMLRASGVPARLVTGFGPGERNLFTGYWEIRNSHSHAWVEVFYPGFGWIPYDPTFGVPSSSAANTTFMLAPLRRLAGAFAVPDALRPLTRAVSSAARALPLPALVVLAGAFAALAVLGAGARRRRSIRSREPPSERDRVVQAWLEVERALGRRGYERADHETVLEFARRAVPLVGSDGPTLRDVAAGFGRVRYGRPTSAEADEWEDRAVVAARLLSSSRG